MKKVVASEDTQPTPLKKSPKYFKLPFPNFSFKETGANGLLVLALVIFAFLLGMLTNKVIYLQQQLNAPTPTPVVDPQQAAAPTPPPFVKDMKVGKLPILGNNNAKVTLVEFSDFQCPYCKDYFDKVNQQINDTYIKTGKIKFAYRHFPLTSIHPNAQKAAEASECANEQNKFWAYHDILFENQDEWSPQVAADAATSFVNYAGQLGMDTEQFQSCLTTEKYKQNVEEDSTVASEAQVDATPTFFVNGTRIVGSVPFVQLQQMIEKELKK